MDINTTSNQSVSTNSTPLESETKKRFEAIWRSITTKLQFTMNQNDYNHWIKPIEFNITDDLKPQLVVSNIIFLQGLRDGFLDKINEVKDQLGFKEDFIISIAGQEESVELENTPEDVLEEGVPEKITEDTNGVLNRNGDVSLINKTNTFENFVSGSSNQFAELVCKQVADMPGQRYNPLFIHGGVGLGKTHLLQAVGNHVIKNQPNTKVMYIQSETFINEYIYCSRFKKSQEFREKYRSVDVLLIDDIQFISGKEKTQEKFFFTFNALHGEGKQIVLTSDRFPQEIPDIQDRLKTRFQWGLIADIQPPDLEHRKDILYSKAKTLKINLSEDVAEFIATHVKKSVRELEGALHRLAAFSNLQGRAINLQTATETFQNFLGHAPKKHTIETIQKIVSDNYNVKVSDLKSKKRQRALTVPRQVAMYLCREITKSSFPEIGSKFGGKDHTTVMHACKKVEKEKIEDLDLKHQIDKLNRLIEQES